MHPSENVSVEPMVGQAVQNTDRHLWPLVSDDAYCATMHVTASGGIGIQCGGHVIVMPLEKWHALGRLRCALEDVMSNTPRSGAERPAGANGSDDFTLVQCG